jgi:hypothetical protein
MNVTAKAFIAVSAFKLSSISLYIKVLDLISISLNAITEQLFSTFTARL